jgi:pyrroloquinoline quinone (PQQ) biosynthesis protein C
MPMTFYAELCRATDRERQELLASPVIVDCLAGRVSLATYESFLTEAYHHVKHTVPLLMACGSRLPERLAWLRPSIVKYIEEEEGHEQWVLNDIAACGLDSGAAAARRPSVATELMVSYAYDTIARGNPIGLFGMVYVLEGTSVTIATRAAEIIQAGLGLPDRAFSYLRSHGSVDVKHIGDFERLVNRFDHPDDRAAVVHCARIVSKLYGDMFRSLPRAVPDARVMPQKEVA